MYLGQQRMALSPAETLARQLVFRVASEGRESAGAKVLAGRSCFGTDPLFLKRRAKSKINSMWDCLVLITSILSSIYLAAI